MQRKRRRRRASKKRSAQQCPAGGKGSSGNECNVVAASQSAHQAVTRCSEAVRSGSGKAGEDREAERTDHHERGADDARG